jgi:hypothetical protein
MSGSEPLKSVKAWLIDGRKSCVLSLLGEKRKKGSRKWENFETLY